MSIDKTVPALWPVRLSFLVVLLLLQACSGGSGGGGSERPVAVASAAGSGEFVYNGPAPASEEIQNFKVSLYDALAANNRCGECHTPGKPGTTSFVDQSNVNEAWQNTLTLVNLTDPASSRLVQRVANGHNCWLGQNQLATCATTVTSYIERWASSGGESTAAVQLSPREAVSPSGARVLPSTLGEAGALGIDLGSSGELLGLLNTYCADCHSESAPVPQVPYFASDNLGTAFIALLGKVDLESPGNSRLVLRLNPEFHNCWSDCSDDANTIREAISRLAAAIPLTEIDESLLISTAAVLERDGIIATSGGRFESSLVAKWEFREGQGNTTADTSGVAPEIPLSLSGQYTWQAGWGVRFVDGKAQGGATSSRKLFNKITATGEYSIEAWVAPANVSQEEAWIAGYAGGPESRNLLLSQSLYNYEAFNRSSVTENNNGAPSLATNDDAELAQASLQHVVVTYSPVVGRMIYVNGVFSEDTDPSGGGLLNNWSEAFALVLGNSTAGSNPWSGTMRMVAIHNTALSPSEVTKNYDIGVGQKYYLMFSVSEILDQAGECHIVEQGIRTNYCYVVFEVSQFDGGSYLFNKPFFANINPAGGEVDFDMRGIRLGINGKIIDVGQAFSNVEVHVEGGNIGDEVQSLADIGTVVALENGGEQDVFFLAFDQLGGESGDVDDGVRGSYHFLANGEITSDITVRTFDEVNATLSRLTGVSTASNSVSAVTGKTVAETYAIVRRALPGVADFKAFMSSHQMAATQLAAAYCDALVQDVELRESLFPAPPVFDFSTPVANSDINWRGHIVTPLVNRAINTGLIALIDRDRIIDEVALLITDNRDLKPYRFINGRYISDPNPAVHNKRDGLIYCLDDRPCPPSRTADVVKASCTAVLGSAAVLLQ
ncbi:MAG: LamG domain-containing protein [Halioglobus sp.]